MLKIIQYNILFESCPNITIDQRLGNICRYLLKKNADVLCLQEVLRNKYDMMRHNLEKKYPFICPEKCFDHRYDTMILSKHPFEYTWMTHFGNTNMGRNMKGVTIKILEEKPMHIVTSHFESVFQDDAKNKIMQYEHCSEMLGQFALPVILCADTNVCDSSENHFLKSFSSSKGWKDAWIDSGSNPGTEITYDGKENKIIVEKNKHLPNRTIYRSRLDRIVHLSNLKCINFEIIGNEPEEILSDHYGIMATFVDPISMHSKQKNRLVDMDPNKEGFITQKKLKSEIHDQ